MWSNFIKALIVGIAASIPIGPIAILVIQKTINKGFKAGFITALGSTIIDAIFAIIAIFALTIVQNFIEGNPIPIYVGGGLIVTVLGIVMMLSNPFKKVKTRAEEHIIKSSADVTVKDMLTAIAMGISNPGAIAVMFALMAFFGINEDCAKDWTVFPIVIGIASGSIVYWLSITAILDKFRSTFNVRTVIWINRLTGGIVIILGLATLAEGIMKACNLS